MKKHTAAIYSTKEKTFCFVSVELAQAMLAMGNPHGFNRACTFPTNNADEMRACFAANGFKEI